MSVPANGNMLLASQDSGYQISRSVRLRSSASAYFSRTPASASNRTTWTWSAWLKRGDLTRSQGLFGAGVLGNNANFQAYWNSNDTIYLQETVQNISNQLIWTSTPVYRDTSAWYHVVIAMDTTQATAANRTKVYVNGLQISGSFSVTPGPSQATSINNNVAHYVGAAPTNSASLLYKNGYMTEVYFVDGQALTPTNFGAFDSATGVWSPIRYTGTYGTNGFYLPFTLNTDSTYSGSFNGSSQYLVSPSNAAFAFGTGDFTAEAWIKPTALANFYTIFGTRTTTNSSTAFTLTMDASGTVGVYTSGFSPITGATITAGVWSHVALTRSGTTARIFINGILSASATLSNNFTDQVFTIGAPVGGGSQLFNGQISNVRLVKGTAVYTANFVPPTSALTAISGTSLLTLQSSTVIDNSTNAFSLTNNGTVVTATATPFGNPNIGADASGNANNWLPVNINATASVTAPNTYDVMVDTPTNYGVDTGAGGEVRGNYAVLSVPASSTWTFSNGNLTGYGGTYNCYFSMPIIGKMYFEVYCSGFVGGGQVGFVKNATIALASVGYNAAGYYGVNYAPTNSYWVNGTNDATTHGTVTNQTMKFAVDGATGKVWIGSGSTWFGSGDPAAGTNPAFTISLSTGDLIFPMLTSQQVRDTFTINTGQQPFGNAAPSGFKAMCTQNMSVPTILNGANYMAATTYTGNGGTQTIANSSGFAPDFVWIKNRGTLTDHGLFDTIRGATKRLSSNVTSVETTEVNSLTAFTSTGFTVGATQDFNQSTIGLVAWQWKGGGTAVTNNNGTIASSVSANTTAGFSVVAYTGNGVTSATVGHGLGAKPSLIITKNRDIGTAAYNWYTNHISLGAGTLELDLTLANNNPATAYSNGGLAPQTSWTDTVFSFVAGTAGNANNVNNNTSKFIAYCWTSITGYSAFGSYTGTSDSNGAFIYCGFRPRYILQKAYNSSSQWMIWDTSRNTYNVLTNAELLANSANQEGVGAWGVEIDILSNGFKFRGFDNANFNYSGVTYIYAAFAENPFTLARAR